MTTTTCPSCSSSSFTILDGGPRTVRQCLHCTRRFVDDAGADVIDALISSARADLAALTAPTTSDDDDDDLVKMFERIDYTTSTRPGDISPDRALPLASSFPPSSYRDGVLRDLGDAYICPRSAFRTWAECSNYPYPYPAAADDDDDVPDLALLFISPHNNTTILGVDMSTLVPSEELL